MGLFSELSCEAGSFSHCRLNPTGVFSQWFEALFPHAGTLGFEVCHLVHQLLLLPCGPTAALPTQLHNLPPRCVHQPPPCHESSPPGCPCPPLLPVWVNVSLSPWLLDFHTVRFSVGSACFLFLNCCCPSFGCARRHSVSTYASILAGSPPNLLHLISSVTNGYLFGPNW